LEGRKSSWNQGKGKTGKGMEKARPTEKRKLPPGTLPKHGKSASRRKRKRSHKSDKEGEIGCYGGEEGREYCPLTEGKKPRQGRETFSPEAVRKTPGREKRNATKKEGGGRKALDLDRSGKGFNHLS